MRPTSLLRSTTAAARASTFALPRTTPIQSSHLSALYQEQLRVAKTFDSYNFRHYFLRKTQAKFHVELPAILASSGELPSPPVEPTKAAPIEAEETGSIYKPTGGSLEGVNVLEGKTPEERLRNWYDETVKELAVMQRAATINQMYQGPRLVVEPGQPSV